MGTSQSSHADGKKTTDKSKTKGAGGRKSHVKEAPRSLLGSVEPEPTAFALSEEKTEEVNGIFSAVNKEEEDADIVTDDEEEMEEEEDEEWEERLRILQDAKSLKTVAGFFLHPEMPVQVDGTACARNYFDRASAPERTSTEDAEAMDLIFEDLKQLKKLAMDYMHPERAVVTSDPTACGRNYFDRPSAVVKEEWEEAEERARIVKEAGALKKLAVDYMHPEIPVVTSDPAACGRNYFDRPSAVVVEEWEEAEERARIVKEAGALKKLAVDYMHPEIPVVTSDPAACGRNYFDRPSAVVEEEWEEAEERARIVKEAGALKKQAVDFLHPEIPVVTSDPAAFGRNYFNRPSAVVYEEDAERACILEEAKALKKLAVDYMHPELPVVTSDPTACGRNYFDRASAVPEEEWEDAEERSRALEEAKALKKLAVDYMHPELPVVTSDPTACGRNYFDRASAVPEEEWEDAEERSRALEEAKALKKLAVDYMHPELPVVTSDPTACGRNYFDRASAVQQERSQYAAERALALAEAKALKNLAVDYMHPELPVVTSDPTACGRNYFDRASAVPPDDAEDAAERALVLADAEAMLKVAIDYLHPELGVCTTDGASRGRNFFERPSALGHDHMVHTFPPHEDDEHHEEHHSEHLDHFGMDEDLRFDDIRAHFPTAFPSVTDASKVNKSQGASSEEGNLSRSPSSVMLFTEEPIYE